jgi:hypothetical protein
MLYFKALVLSRLKNKEDTKTNFVFRQTLESVVHCSSGSHQPDSDPVVMSKEEVELLSLYHKAFNDDDVDYNLIKAIVEYIQTEYQVNF